MPLWGGVFDSETDDLVRQLNDSLPFDWRLYADDITGSQAWASALEDAGILTAEERVRISEGLTAVRVEFETGRFSPSPGDEDIHTAVERRLTELIGPVAGKLHTGRSRNDQVATDLRLWTRRHLSLVIDEITALEQAFVNRADSHVETLMPGYTHFQPAQPVTVAHWLLGHAQAVERDRQRFIAVRARLAECPLGSGALAGTPYPIDRERLARELGFERPTPNSLDAVADRDYVLETLFAASMLAAHLSRFAEDLIVFANPQMGFVTLDERYSTGSSLMPQKRNPDPLELARGKAGRIFGHLTGLLATLKGLPSGYNKDLQEDKEPLFDTIDTLMRLLPVLSRVVDTLQFNPARMEAALDENMLATDLADYLVMKGIPFREAHHLAGQVVRRVETLGIALSALPLADLQQISSAFAEDVATVFDFRAAVARRNVIGGPAPEAVRRQIALLRRQLDEATP